MRLLRLFLLFYLGEAITVRPHLHYRSGNGV
jgi:hypothetical protein